MRVDLVGLLVVGCFVILLLAALGVIHL